MISERERRERERENGEKEKLVTDSLPPPARSTAVAVGTVIIKATVAALLLAARLDIFNGPSSRYY